MRNFNVKNPLARPWLFSILLICFAIGQLISALLLSINHSSPDFIVLSPAVNFSLILWALAIATATPELVGLRIIKLPIYIFMIVQMLVSLLPLPHLTGLIALLQIPQVLAMISGLVALTQITLWFKKYFI